MTDDTMCCRNPFAVPKPMPQMIGDGQYHVEAKTVLILDNSANTTLQPTNHLLTQNHYNVNFNRIDPYTHVKSLIHFNFTQPSNMTACSNEELVSAITPLLNYIPQSIKPFLYAQACSDLEKIIINQYLYKEHCEHCFSMNILNSFIAQQRYDNLTNTIIVSFCRDTGEFILSRFVFFTTDIYQPNELLQLISCLSTYPLDSQDKLTQDQISFLLGTHQPTISKIVNSPYNQGF